MIYAHLFGFEDLDRYTDQALDRAWHFADHVHVTTLATFEASAIENGWRNFATLSGITVEDHVLALYTSEFVVDPEMVRPAVRNFANSVVMGDIYYMLDRVYYATSGALGPSTEPRLVPWEGFGYADGLLPRMYVGSRSTGEALFTVVNYLFAEKGDRELFHFKYGTAPWINAAKQVWRRGGLING